MHQDNQTKKNLVTIVTVTYNAEDLLEETLLSVINQTYKNIEYIIIDGSSTDNTLEIIKKYEGQISYWISESDEGIYFAMNKGIKKATGEWINFMNAGDTFVDNTTIQKVINSLDEDTELIYGDHICDGIVGSVKERKVTRLMPCCHQSLFVKTALMKQYPYNTFYSISADYEFLLKMYQLGKKFKYIEEPLARYMRNGFSDQNQTRWYLETLTLMMNNHIDLDEIVQSPAYNLIENKKLTHLQHKYDIDIDKAEKNLVNLNDKFINLKDKFDLLMKSLSSISNTKTLTTPFKKIRAYKKLLSLYHKL